MKWNQQWKPLSRDQRQAWRQWAKSNPVRLDNGVVRRVSGHKALTVVLNKRAVAGDAANPTVIPVATTWLSDALSLNDAGPFTVGEGFMGLRATQEIPAGEKWFVWATPPLPAAETDAHRWLRFVKCQTVGALGTNELTGDFASDYRAVLGSFDGPGESGEWPEDHFVWFRVQQYANGQLGPGEVLKGRIQLEL